MPELGRRGMPLRTGVHKELEDVANEILRVELSAITRHADKADILTPWKEQSRRSREVYVREGTPDSAVRRGNFNRAWNPSAHHLNSVEGFPRPKFAQEKAPGEPTWDSE